jgi:hypothetical protein
LHVERGQPVRPQRRRVEPHVHLPRAAADDLDLADAVDALDLAADLLVGDLGQIADRVAAADRHQHHG